MYKVDITKEQLDKWLVALRSDEYKQSRHMLRSTDGGFCCLGLLAYVINPENYDDTPNESGGYIYHSSQRSSAYSLAFDWLSTGIQDKLTVMNDESKLSFKEIADWIEANLKPTDA